MISRISNKDTFNQRPIHSFIQAFSKAPLQIHYYSEALPTQHGYCVCVSHRSATGNSERRTCPRSLLGGQSGIRTRKTSDERRRIYQASSVSSFLCVSINLSVSANVSTSPCLPHLSSLCYSVCRSCSMV